MYEAMHNAKSIKTIREASTNVPIKNFPGFVDFSPHKATTPPAFIENGLRLASNRMPNHLQCAVIESEEMAID